MKSQLFILFNFLVLYGSFFACCFHDFLFIFQYTFPDLSGLYFFFLYSLYLCFIEFLKCVKLIFFIKFEKYLTHLKNIFISYFFFCLSVFPLYVCWCASRYPIFLCACVHFSSFYLLTFKFPDLSFLLKCFTEALS